MNLLVVIGAKQQASIMVSATPVATVRGQSTSAPEEKGI
jgi:hypothetical protein